jgi:hypothetical protein
MSILKHFPLLGLAALNLLAFGMLLSADDVYASGVDDCDEGTASGCDCIFTASPPWLPEGCYETGNELKCLSGNGCGPGGQT